jgi:hypothetical protein
MVRELAPVTAHTVMVVIVVPTVTVTRSSGESSRGSRQDERCKQEIFHKYWDATFLFPAAQSLLFLFQPSEEGLE